MLVCLSFFSGDLPLALANLSLAQYLGGCAEFDCVLVTDDQTPYAEMQRIAAQTFRRVEVLVLPNVPQGWPRAANVQFERTAKHVWQRYPTEPFLFLEADTTPIRPGWLKDVATVYQTNGLPFMGPVRPLPAPVDGNSHSFHGLPKDNMNGVAVYPASYYSSSDILRIVPNSHQAFDIALSDEQQSREFLASGKLTVGRTNSALFSHSWKTENFRLEGDRIVYDQQDPRAAIDEINPRVTALFHGDKSGTLAELIRKAQPEGSATRFSPQTGLSADGKIHDLVHRENQAVGEKIDPEYAEFLAWKRAKEQNATAFVPSVFPVRTAVEANAATEAVRQSWEAQLAQASGVAVVRPDPYAPVAAESLAAVNPPPPAISGAPVGLGLQKPAPLDSVAVGADAHLEPFNDPAQALASIPAGLPPTEIEKIADRLRNAAVSLPTTEQQSQSAPEQMPPTQEKSVAHQDSSDEPTELSAEEKREAVKADIRAGMAWRLLLSSHSLTPKLAKEIKDEVAKEKPAKKAK